MCFVNIVCMFLQLYLYYSSALIALNTLLKTELLDQTRLNLNQP